MHLHPPTLFSKANTQQILSFFVHFFNLFVMCSVAVPPSTTSSSPLKDMQVAVLLALLCEALKHRVQRAPRFEWRRDAVTHFSTLLKCACALINGKSLSVKNTVYLLFVHVHVSLCYWHCFVRL